MTMLPISSREPVAVAGMPASILYLPAVARDRVAVISRLNALGLAVTSAGSLSEALAELRDGGFTMVLLDLTNQRTAVPSIHAIRAQFPNLPIAAIVDPAHPLTSAEAVNAGIADLLTWPFDELDVAAVVANARDRGSVNPISPGAGFAGTNLVAHSPAMRLTMDAVRVAASGDSGVLVCGEAGSGRQTVARAIHALGSRAEKPFVVVDCAGTSPDQLDLILFGFASDKRAGGTITRTPERLESAGAVFRALGGTLFVTNVPDAPDRVQAKLVRLVRDREALVADRRAVVEIDLRLMAAVDSRPDLAVADGRLRSDLLERFAGQRIDVPPLRRRREDIPVLAVHILGDIAQARGTGPQRLTRSALALLAALPWPGNGVEFRSVLDTVAHAVRRPVIEIDDLFDQIRLDGVAARVDASGTLRDARARFERDWISAVLVKHQGRVGEAARALGIQRTNLYRKVRQLNVARTLLASRGRA